MPINVLRNKTPQQVHDDVNGFPLRYITDWNDWLTVDDGKRWSLFGKIMRKWQATRPNRMRRLQQEAQHAPPYLDDLIRKAQRQLEVLGYLTVSNIHQRTAFQEKALRALWTIFANLPVKGIASCVGRTKAVLLLTNGRIGPALDSRVRRNLRIGPPTTPQEWISLLGEIADDIDYFEARHHQLFREIVPAQFAHLEYGRLYDMALGPRGRPRVEG